MGEFFDYVESELIRFRVEKGAKEPRPPSEDKPWVSQHDALFVADFLRSKLPRVYHVQGLETMAEPPLIALAQTLLLTLDEFFKEPFMGIVADTVNARVFSSDSSHQLTILGGSPLPLAGCSSRHHRHTDFSFRLGIPAPAA